MQPSEQPTTANPFIITLAIDEAASQFFNEQRQRYFPPNLNFLKAHLTLFHFLPLTGEELIEQLKGVSEKQAPFSIQVTDVVSLGKGTAYKLESKELQVLHKNLQQLWKPLLKPQDIQKLWPHITIQNKVTPQAAKDLQQQLKPAFEPFSFGAIGLSLWEYLNGPWRFVETVNFSS